MHLHVDTRTKSNSYHNQAHLILSYENRHTTLHPVEFCF
jgi:hypothetical protein